MSNSCNSASGLLINQAVDRLLELRESGRFIQVSSHTRRNCFLMIVVTEAITVPSRRTRRNPTGRHEHPGCRISSLGSGRHSHIDRVSTTVRS